MAQPVRLQDAITEYLSSRAGVGMRPNTVRNDGKVLTAFLAENGNVYTKTLNPSHIDRYFTAKSHLQPSSLNAEHFVLRAFLKWCRLRNYMPRDYDPMAGRRPRKVPQKARLFIPVTRFGELLDAAETPRDRMLCAFGLYLFLRQSESVTLRWEDWDHVNDEVDVTIHKTQERDRMPVCSELDEELRAWKTWLTERYGPPRPDWYIVPSRFNIPEGRIKGRWAGTPDGYRLRPTMRLSRPHEVINRALAALGYETHGEGCHTLRRSGARARFDALREMGYDGALQQVRAMLHHSSVTMTEKYLGINIERAQRDAMLKGQVMYPQVVPDARTVVSLHAGEVT